MRYAMTRWTTISGVVLLLSVYAGCGGGGDESAGASSTSLSVSGPGVVAGKAVDASTRLGVSGAAVKLFVDSEAQTVTTAEDDATTTDTDERGDFSLRDIAAGRHRVRIESAAYATYETWVTIEPSTSTFYATIGGDGRAFLERGCSTDVFVTADGTPLADATVYATGPGPEIVGVTDGSGKATLAGLGQNSEYTVIVPALDRGADGAADGTYDYLTTSRSYRCINSEKVLALDTNKAERDDSIAIIGGTSEKYEFSAIAPGEDIRLVFNYPVALDTTGIFARYAGSLFSDDGSGIDVPIDATLSAGNTLLTIHPRQAPPVHATLTLAGTVSAQIYGGPSFFTFGSYPAGNWYIFDPAPLSDASLVSVDNYNSHTGQAGGAKTVSLEFPERVYGNATLLAYTANGVVVTPGSLTTTDFSSSNSVTELLRDKKSGGCTSGVCGGDAIRYRVSLNYALPSMEDDRPGAANTVTLAINAVDADGHRLTKTVTLPVE